MIIYKPFHRGGYYAAEPDPIRFSYGFQDLLAGIAETSYDSDRVPGNVVLEQHPLAEVAEITINQFPYIRPSVFDSEKQQTIVENSIFSPFMKKNPSFTGYSLYLSPLISSSGVCFEGGFFCIKP